MSGATEASAPNAGQGTIGTPGSLPNQKRPLDYGEQLKGLSPSDDEDHPNDASFPASKKQKRDNSDSGHDSDLDDGEIVESSPNSPAHVNSVAEAVAAPFKTSAPDNVTHEPSEDGEIGSPMAKPQESNELNQPFFIDKTGSKPVQHSGWNHGLSLGARTSFGKPAAQLFPPSSQRGQDGGGGEREEEEGDDDDEEKDRDYVPPAESIDNEPRLTFTIDESTWYLPHITFRAKKHSVHTTAFCNDRIQTWINAFLEANEKTIDQVSVEVIREGLSNHINRKGGHKLFKGTKKHADAATSSAQKAMDDPGLEGLVEKKIRQFRTRKAKPATGKNSKESKVAPANKPSQDAVPVTDKQEEQVLNEEDELRQQRKYFPWAEDPAQYCLSCSGIGHRAHECPQRNCKFCGSQEHSLFGCPTKQRCSKCRQLGHSSASCGEKLALTLDEQGGCAICGAEHAEEACSEIWRSFAPIASINNKVKDVPSFCYTCGAAGHYGPECGLPDRGDKVTGKTTWSQANRLLYMDQKSENIAIAWVGVEQKEDFHILGRAKRQTHTHFVSSEESEDEFVHAPVRKPELRGQIRIATNIGSLGESGNNDRPRVDERYRRRQNIDFHPPPPSPYGQGRGNSWQPPLPPGPPPPSQRNGYQGSLPYAPTSLPPRPPAYNQSPSKGGSGGRGGHFGRGGRGGRGRGRGRGRGQ